MYLTEKEMVKLWGMRQWLRDPPKLNRALGSLDAGITACLSNSAKLDDLCRSLVAVGNLKTLFQRIHNFNHTLAMLAAKQFLAGEFPKLPWATIEFGGDPNANGLDVNLQSYSPQIVGEVKTTEPCGKSGGFGAQQRKNIENDLRKLSAASEPDCRRYMFVTDPKGFHLLKTIYREKHPTVNFVFLRHRPEVDPAAGVTQPASA